MKSLSRSGDKRLMNMVALGAMLALLPVLPVAAIEKALEDHLPARHKKLLPVNFTALRQGADFASKIFQLQRIE